MADPIVPIRPRGGGVPGYGSVPGWPDPRSTAGEATRGNVANWPDIQTLAALYNQYQNQASIAPYEANLPGYTGMMGKQSENIGYQLAGMVPPDVIALMQQQAAERGIMTGAPLSPNSNAAYLRALGLTSIGQQEAGAQGLQRAIGEIPLPKLFDPNTMFVTPEQQQVATGIGSIYESAPDPYQAWLAARNAVNQGVRGTPTTGGDALGPSRITGGGGTPSDFMDRTLPWNRGGTTPAVGMIPNYASQAMDSAPPITAAQQAAMNANAANYGYGPTIFGTNTGGYTPQEQMLGAGSNLYSNFTNMLDAFGPGLGSFDMGFGNQQPQIYEPDMFSPEWLAMMGYDPASAQGSWGIGTSGLGGFDQGFSGSGNLNLSDLGGSFSGGTPNYYNFLTGQYGGGTGTGGYSIYSGGVTSTSDLIGGMFGIPDSGSWDNWSDSDWNNLESWLGDSGSSASNDVWTYDPASDMEWYDTSMFA